MSIVIPVSGRRFFSVKYNTAIGTYQFRPAVCYRLTDDIQAEVEGMAGSADGLARIYEEEVRFISGVPYPVKKSDAPAVSSSASSSAPLNTALPSIARPGRRRKEFV